MPQPARGKKNDLLSLIRDMGDPAGIERAMSLPSLATPFYEVKHTASPLSERNSPWKDTSPNVPVLLSRKRSDKGKLPWPLHNVDSQLDAYQHDTGVGRTHWHELASPGNSSSRKKLVHGERSGMAISSAIALPTGCGSPKAEFARKTMEFEAVLEGQKVTTPQSTSNSFTRWRESTALASMNFGSMRAFPKQEF